MGRHADPTVRRRVTVTRPVLIAAGLVVLLLAGGLAWWATAGPGGCDRTQSVDVTVAPELGKVAERLLSDLPALDGDVCVAAHVTAQEPLQTVGSLGALEQKALPDVWVPDSSLWTTRAGDAKFDARGSMASSPVVLATSKAAADSLGWSDKAPSWGEALNSGRPLAMPDLAASAEGLAALAAVRASLGGGPDADNAVVQAVLSTERGKLPSPAAALADGAKDAPDAPLVPVSEQAVVAADRADGASLVAVYPDGGSPALDYPVLGVGSPSAAQRPAVDAVVRALTSADGQKAVRAAGFRGADGAAPTGTARGIRAEAPRTLALDPAQVQGLLTRLASLAKPSRLLAVFDVSTSMRAAVGDGTRATLARDAGKSALSLFPDRSSIGLWLFARRMQGDQDWLEVVPTRPLDTDTGAMDQRQRLRAALDSIPGRLAPGGTGLYDTTLAAVRSARANYDPTSVSSVVIITDGKDEDDGSIGLDRLVSTLRSEVDPTRPIKVIGIALGPDADQGALKRIAQATGGAAYSAVDPTDLQSVLFDALRQRR